MMITNVTFNFTIYYFFAYAWLHLSLFFELSKTTNNITANGPWAYQNTRSEIENSLKWIPTKILKFTLNDVLLHFIRFQKIFYGLICIIIFLAINSYHQINSTFSNATLVYLYGLIILQFLFIFLHYVVCIRFRGLYNGGSDMMMMVIGIGQLINLCCLIHGHHFMWGYLFIAVNLVISYFKAGLVKARSIDWISGQALVYFIEHTNSRSLLRSFVLLNTKNMSLFFWKCLSYSVIIIELSMPLALISHSLFWFYATWAFIFHLNNFLIFGLNRFFWTWVLAWPSFYYIFKVLHTY